ncbi:MAG: PDZ domain-containing protein [Singulisphaera sp.]
MGETGECLVVVDAGANDAGEQPREGELSLAGLSDARIVKGEDGRLKITHLFHEVKGISDFSYLEETWGVSLNRGDGTLVLSPVPIAGQKGKVCMLNYPSCSEPPIEVTLDLEKLPPAFTLNVQVEKLAPDEKFVVMLSGDGRASRIKAIWYPVDRKKATTLFDQAIESGRGVERVLQLPREAISADARLNLKFGYWGDTPAAIRSLEVEARIIPSFGAELDLHPTRRVVFVKRVIKHLPSDQAGLRAGDIVESIGGEKVRGVDEAMLLLSRTQIGENFKVGIRRDGKPIEIRVKPE